MAKVIGKIKQFVGECISELNKCTWPGKSELFESTVLVIFMIIVLAVYVLLIDECSRNFISLITTGSM